MDKKLQKKAIEFERRLEAGEVKLLSPDETRRALRELVKFQKATRKRIAPK